jgi:hypothetical protein
MADVQVKAEELDDTPASLAVRLGLLGGGLALSTIAHLTFGGVVLFASPRLFATIPENSMTVDIVTPQEFADAQQEAVENVAEPATPQQTGTLPAATPSQQAPLQRQNDLRPQQAASPRPQSPLAPQQTPLQRQSDLRPQTAPPQPQPLPDPQQAPTQQQSDLQAQAPPQTPASPEQALPDPTQVAALLNLSMQVANPNLDGPPSDSAAKLSADDIAAFKQYVKTCWVAPTTNSDAKPTVVVRVSLGPNGRLRAEPDLVSISNASSSAEGLALVSSVKHALTRCQPYSVLPAGKYQDWKILDLNFSRDGIADVGSPQSSGNGG